nr:hypothetical protein [Tanacetum cinerariifolium]
SDNQNVLQIPEYFENNDLKAQLQAKDTIIYPLALTLFKNKDAHIDYLKYTQEQADILRGIVKQAKVKQPLDNMLDFALAVVLRAVDIAATPSSTTIDQGEPSSSTSATNQQQQSLIISQGVEEPIPNAHFDDPCQEPFHDVSTSQESSLNVQSSHSPLDMIGK